MRAGSPVVLGVLVASRGQAIASGVVGQVRFGPVTGPFVRVSSQLFVPTHDPVDAVLGDEALECFAKGGTVEISLGDVGELVAKLGV